MNFQHLGFASEDRTEPQRVSAAGTFFRNDETDIARAETDQRHPGNLQRSHSHFAGHAIRNPVAFFIQNFHDRQICGRVAAAPGGTFGKAGDDLTGSVGGMDCTRPEFFQFPPQRSQLPIAGPDRFADADDPFDTAAVDPVVFQILSQFRNETRHPNDPFRMDHGKDRGVAGNGVQPVPDG